MAPALANTIVGRVRLLSVGGVGIHSATGARPFFTRFAQQRQLQSLEKDAAAYPVDPVKQAEYLKKLNTLDPEAG